VLGVLLFPRHTIVALEKVNNLARFFFQAIPFHFDAGRSSAARIEMEGSLGKRTEPNCSLF